MNRTTLLFLTAMTGLLLLVITYGHHLSEPGGTIERKSLPASTPLTLHTFQHLKYVSLNELKSKFPVTFDYSETEGTLRIRRGSIDLTMLKGTGVIARDGIYLPFDAQPYFEPSKDSNMKIFLPLAAVKHGLGMELQFTAGELKAYPAPISDDQTAHSQTAFDARTATPDELIEYLSFLSSPIKGATLSVQDSHLPGAARDYRNGKHEGIDWYSEKSGVLIDRGTKVLAAADGVVVRADTDYRELSTSERESLLSLARQAAATPAYILDRLRGRTVWVQHDKGVLIRYAHLGRIQPHIKIGSRVHRGDWLGNVGNSGTRSAVAGYTDLDLHLHIDLLIYDQPFWRHLHREHIRDVLSRIF